MSTLQQTEQTTPATPAAGTQLAYPKVGGQFVVASDGIEKQLLDSRALAMCTTQLDMNIWYSGGL